MDNGEAQSRGELGVGRRWTFGPAVFDERTLELTVRGAIAKLERKPLEVLLYLLHHAGEVVTKEELAENLWPGRILTETVLTRCISHLRQALADDDRKLIRTIHGFGYRLVAEVRVDASTTPPPPALALKIGDHPPSRPQWRLEERLGTGGHGEAWLARHEKTHEARVFKFALDVDDLVSLKREITLYRVLTESVGDRARVARILEWNLEEAPYFIEAEYVPGRDLHAWAESQGGLAALSLERRLELVTQVADALAAAHSVGVLHKDLKPGNVLVAIDAEGQPQICLCDFGSGWIVDTSRLEALGITNLGFNTATTRDTSGTALYLAPEVLSGQPFTVAADVYALGVLLYQIAVGDFRKACAPGWDLDIQDDLLRADIAAAAAGDPTRRLADAAQLAERLRTRDARRLAREAENATRERAERARRVLAELRRTRAFALAVLVFATAAIAGGNAAYWARGDAVAARMTAEAVNDFLMNDVLSVDPAIERPKDASYESLLARAAAHIDARFTKQPEAAARLHWLLGRRFREVGQINAAKLQYEKAAALLSDLHGHNAMPALLAMSRLLPIYVERGRTAEVKAISRQVLERWGAEFGPTDLSTFLLRVRIARLLGRVGEIKETQDELRAVIADLPRATPPSAATRAAMEEWLGFALSADTSRLDTNAKLVQATAGYANAVYAEYLGLYARDYRKALSRFRETLVSLTPLFGKESEIVAAANFAIAALYAQIEQPTEAHGQLREAREFIQSLPARHWIHGVAWLVEGRIEVEGRKGNAAIGALRKAAEHCLANGCSPSLIDDIDYELGRAYELAGDRSTALVSYRRSLATCETLQGSSNLACLLRRLSLADALRSAGHLDEASATLLGIAPRTLASLPAPNLTVADYKRIQGLLWIASGRDLDGSVALRESLEIVNQQLDAAHWQVRRAQAEVRSAEALLSRGSPGLPKKNPLQNN